MSSSNDIIHANWKARKQTFIIPLTFSDITDAKDIITRIGYGGDIWEVRVDLLTQSREPITDINIASLDYVRLQIKALQDFSPLPILFTIRTKSQGGRFPDFAHKEAAALLLLAIESGIAYIDVEIEWPQELIKQITTNKGTTKVVASYHNWTGKVAWTSQELKDKFDAADAFGDIIKLSILSAEIEDCFELGLFVRDYRAKHTKPLLAVGMGQNGQLSRVTSPISLVTHPLIPFPSAPGQLSLAQVHQAQYLIGQLPKKSIILAGAGSHAERVRGALQTAFCELGLPHECTLSIKKENAESLEVEVLRSKDDLVSYLSDKFEAITSRRAPVSVIEDYLSN